MYNYNFLLFIKYLLNNWDENIKLYEVICNNYSFSKKNSIMLAVFMVYNLVLWKKQETLRENTENSGK